MFSCKQGQTSGSNITKKMFWWNDFCNSYVDYYKRKCSKELFCNNFGQNGTETATKADNRCNAVQHVNLIVQTATFWESLVA